MKIFYNSKIAKALTFMGGFSTIMLFGVVFTEQDSVSARLKEHERIHAECQFPELIGLGASIGIPLAFLLAALFNISAWLFFTLAIVLPLLSYYIWYGIEWLILVLKGQKVVDAYYNIGFEKEAYYLQNNWDKICNDKIQRKPFGWFNFNKKYKV